jgi:hypothetical protein
VARILPVHQPGEVIQAVEAEDGGWAGRIGEVQPVVPRGLEDGLASPSRGAPTTPPSVTWFGSNAGRFSTDLRMRGWTR